MLEHLAIAPPDATGQADHLRSDRIVALKTSQDHFSGGGI